MRKWGLFFENDKIRYNISVAGLVERSHLFSPIGGENTKEGVKGGAKQVRVALVVRAAVICPKSVLFRPPMAVKASDEYEMTYRQNVIKVQ